MVEKITTPPCAVTFGPNTATRGLFPDLGASFAAEPLLRILHHKLEAALPRIRHLGVFGASDATE